MARKKMPLPPHTSCFHKGYTLTCAEYEELRSITPGRCHWCGVSTDKLQIDHDHAVGHWAVRGLLCRSCNHCIQLVECGKYVQYESARRYLTGAWHLGHPASAGKKRRAMPRAACPACGVECGFKKNGEPTVHASRLPGSYDKTCSGRLQPAEPG